MEEFIDTENVMSFKFQFYGRTYIESLDAVSFSIFVNLELSPARLCQASVFLSRKSLVCKNVILLWIEFFRTR